MSDFGNKENPPRQRPPSQYNKHERDRAHPDFFIQEDTYSGYPPPPPPRSHYDPHDYPPPPPPRHHPQFGQEYDREPIFSPHMHEFINYDYQNDERDMRYNNYAGFKRKRDDYHNPMRKQEDSSWSINEPQKVQKESLDFETTGKKLEQTKLDSQKNLIQHLKELIKENNKLGNGINRFKIESIRVNCLRELRNYYGELVTNYLQIEPPKESFNRWLIERSLLEGRTDPIIPSKKSKFSTVTERELSDDLPYKIQKISKIMEEVIKYEKEALRRLDEYEKKQNGDSKINRKEVESLLKKIIEKAKKIEKNEDALKLVKELNKRINPFFKDIYKEEIEKVCIFLEIKSLELAEHVKKCSLENRNSGEEPFIKVTFTVNKAELEYGTKKFIINKFHYEKLRKFYRLNTLNDQKEWSRDKLKEFNRDLWLMLQRYENFFNDRKKEITFEGSGHQGAVPNQVMRYIHEKLDVCMECFASPLNSFFRLYCSAFPDTDTRFGSIGDFFKFNPIYGSFEANPPFVEELMIKMLEHMEERISEAEIINSPLSFFVVVPNWEDSKAIINLKNSRYKRKERILKKDAHRYISGFQHRQDRVHYTAVHETRIFFIQSRAGYEKWKPTEEILEEIVKLFSK